MIKFFKCLIGCFSLFCLFPSLTFSAVNNMYEHFSIVVDDFDDPANRNWLEDNEKKTEPRTWSVRGSSFSEESYPLLKYVPGAPTKRDIDTSQENRQFLAIQSKFKYRGYNYFEIIPTVNNEEGFSLPGNTLALSVWVWGSNYNYTLEAHVTDVEGKVFVIPMGSLNFLGWRNLSARIPFSYSKDKYNPWGASIKLKRFVVRTHPKERVDNYMMYMDDIKVETIKDYTPYNGGELFNPRRINEIWANSN